MIRQGRVVRYSKAQCQESQAKGQGTVRLPPQWATTEAARREARAKIKNFSHNNLLKETELKAALTGSTGRAKGSPPKEAKQLKKGKTLTLCSNLEVAEGCDVGGNEVADE